MTGGGDLGEVQVQAGDDVGVGKIVLFDCRQVCCMCVHGRASDFLQSLVPISQFNKGQAAKIFDRLRSEKELIVLKNNQPSAIILSPEEYTRLTEIEEDYFLLLEANKRLDDNGNKETVSYDSVMKHLGISEAELLEAEDADIE